MKNKLLFVFCFMITLDNSNGQVIKSDRILNDTSIINSSSFKAYKLFSEKDVKDQLIKVDLSSKIGIYGKLNMLIIMVGEIEINITVDGSHIFKLSKGINDYQKVDYIQYKGNREFIIKNGLQEPFYKLEKVKIKMGTHNLIIDRKKMSCDDTGNNPLTLIDKSNKKIMFKNIKNLIVFEYDIDNDGVKEIYIIDYIICQSKITMYSVAP